MGRKSAPEHLTPHFGIRLQVEVVGSVHRMAAIGAEVEAVEVEVEAGDQDTATQTITPHG